MLIIVVGAMAAAEVLVFSGVTINVIASFVTANLVSVMTALTVVVTVWAVTSLVLRSAETDRDIEIAREKGRLQKEIDELEEGRQKFKTFIDANFEDILKQREHASG
jgi:hypothetical protein